MNLPRGAVRFDHEVLHITRVMPLGIIEAMFLAFRIEVAASRFEVRRFTLRDLVEVDSMFARSQVVELKFERHARTLVPDDDGTNIFSLGVLQLHFGFRKTGR